MKKVFILFVVSIFFVPVFVFAQNPPAPPVSELIPCGEMNGGQLKECTFNDLLVLVENVIGYIVTYLIIPAGTISFAYFGFKLVMNPSNPTVRSDARKGLAKVAIGIAVIVSAWLIVKFVLDNLLDQDTSNAVKLLNL